MNSSPLLLVRTGEVGELGARLRSSLDARRMLPSPPRPEENCKRDRVSKTTAYGGRALLTNSRPRETERSGEVWGGVSVLAVLMLAVSGMAR